MEPISKRIVSFSLRGASLKSSTEFPMRMDGIIDPLQNLVRKRLLRGVPYKGKPRQNCWKQFNPYRQTSVTHSSHNDSPEMKQAGLSEKARPV